MWPWRSCDLPHTSVYTEGSIFNSTHSSSRTATNWCNDRPWELPGFVVKGTPTQQLWFKLPVHQCFTVNNWVSWGVISVGFMQCIGGKDSEAKDLTANWSVTMPPLPADGAQLKISPTHRDDQHCRVTHWYTQRSRMAKHKKAGWGQEKRQPPSSRKTEEAPLEAGLLISHN